ncbi:MAG: hypothetical protein ABI193_16230 [Minicystis sp.]
MRLLLLTTGLLVALSVAGCGARSTVLEGDAVTADPLDPALPVDLLAPDGASCVKHLDVQTAPEVMAPDSDQGIAVVDIAFATECTNAGGDYVLAREIDGFSSFWLGQHACEFTDAVFGPGILYGVVLYRQTAALFQLSAEVCVGFPGEPPGLQTSLITDAIALFETLPEARAFASALEAGKP